MWTEENEDHIWSRHEILPDEVEQVVNTRPRWVTKGTANTELIYHRRRSVPARGAQRSR